MKKSVKEYMTPLPQTIGVAGNLYLAKMTMDEHACHHLPVLDGGKLVGMLSYLDLSLMILTSKGKDGRVRDVMTVEPFIVDPETPVQDVAKQMIQQKISSAIVSAKGQAPWGIFTSTDALRIVSEM
jgi:CBS domain-containing protein